VSEWLQLGYCCGAALCVDAPASAVVPLECIEIAQEEGACAGFFDGTVCIEHV
jgi:hypothetical protein